MAGSTFQTKSHSLSELLEDCHSGLLQLPDFQRSWVWDEDRIKSLIASISLANPVGAVMTLDVGGEVHFQTRPVEGAPVEAQKIKPHALLLDGQQRITSLYQVTLRGKVVETVSGTKQKVKRWFYIDICKALDTAVDREEAILGVPEDRVIHSNCSTGVELDLSTRENEYAALMFPTTQVFDWENWQSGFNKHWADNKFDEIRGKFHAFRSQVLDHFWYYEMPVIAINRFLSLEALPAVFRGINSDGTRLCPIEVKKVQLRKGDPEVSRN